MFSHLVTFLMSSAFAASYSHSPSISPSGVITPSMIPSTLPDYICIQDTTPEIVLGSLLGASLTGIVVTVFIRRNIHDCYRIFGHNGDTERVYDTPCPYCKIKQPANCIREHLSECTEHLKHWAPKLASQRHLLNV